MLKILSLAPKDDELSSYVSVWTKVISACSQELKHGTWIWKQSLEKNVHREILSEHQGSYNDYVTCDKTIFNLFIYLKNPNWLQVEKFACMAPKIDLANFFLWKTANLRSW